MDKQHHNTMTIYLATDHAGYDLKEKVREFLEGEGYIVEDLGAHTFDESDDYPDFISKISNHLPHSENKAIIFGGSGQGEAIVANKCKGVRAIVYYGGSEEIISLSREHNDANVLSIGARFVDQETLLPLIQRWIDTPFPGDERHARRIAKIAELEN